MSIRATPGLFSRLLGTILDTFILILATPIESSVPFFSYLDSLATFFTLPLALRDELLRLSDEFYTLGIDRLGIIGTSSISFDIFTGLFVLLLGLIDITYSFNLSDSSTDYRTVLDTILIGITRGVSLVYTTAISTP